MSKVRVHWYCGADRTPDDGWSIPDDYGTEFETEEDAITWEEGDCTTFCPTCGCELSQGYDEPWLVEDSNVGVG